MGIERNAKQLLEQYQAQSKTIEEQIDKTTNDITTTLLYKNKLGRTIKSYNNSKNFGGVGGIGFAFFLGVSLVMANWVAVGVSVAGLATTGCIAGVSLRKEKKTKQIIAKAEKVVGELEKHIKSLESEKQFLASKIEALQILIDQKENVSQNQLEDIKNAQNTIQKQELKQDITDFVAKSQEGYYGKSDDDSREV